MFGVPSHRAHRVDRKCVAGAPTDIPQLRTTLAELRKAPGPYAQFVRARLSPSVQAHHRKTTCKMRATGSDAGDPPSPGEVHEMKALVLARRARAAYAESSAIKPSASKIREGTVVGVASSGRSVASSTAVGKQPGCVSALQFCPISRGSASFRRSNGQTAAQTECRRAGLWGVAESLCDGVSR